MTMVGLRLRPENQHWRRKNINPNPDLTGFEDDVQIIGED